MDDCSSDDCITIKKQYGFVSNSDSLKIADAIEAELFPFFNREVVQDTESNIIVVERKGLNLFHPYLQNIEGFRNVISIKFFDQHKPSVYRLRFFAFTNFDNSNILLTDAVTTGSETRKILKGSIFQMKLFGGYKKVCGYLALKNAINELELEFPNISFKFLRIIEDLDEYYVEHKKISYVYQKRMEPIDEEHPYILVNVIPEIELEEIKAIINDIIRNRYGNSFELIDNELGIDTKYNFTVYFNNPLDLLQSVFNVQLQKGDQIEKLAIRFKFSSSDSKLRITALSMPNLNKETRFECVKRIITSSCSRKLPDRRCSKNFRYRLFFKKYRCPICAECIDANISLLLARDVYSLITTSRLVKAS